MFFFSSRRRHTRCGRDWSSDVCSSDLPSSPSLPFGDEDFSIGVWVNTSSPGSDISGDILSYYDPNQRKGLHLSIKKIGRASCRERGVDFGVRRICKKNHQSTGRLSLSL